MGEDRREGTELRRRFMEDMVLSGKFQRTVGACVDAVRHLAEHYWKPPDRLTEEEVRGYLLHLVNEKKVARGTHTIALCAITLFYELTVQREWRIFDLARPRSERKLPVVLSREETWRILDCVSIPGCRVCLTTIYALGLRLMEGMTLTPAQVDSDRMVVHIRGKGAKDRYVPIQTQTVELLRGFWKTHRAARWLFPAATRHGIEHSLATNAGPVDRSSVQSAFQRARVKAGVRKKAHVHLLFPAGGLSPDGKAGIKPKSPKHLLPNYILADRFRTRMRQALEKAGLLQLVPGKVRTIRWVADVSPVGSGDNALRYISRYLLRVAISNHRIERFEDDRVTFRWTDSHTRRIRRSTLDVHAFIARFLQHVLPSGFVKVRTYGLWASTCRPSLDAARSIFSDHPAVTPTARVRSENSKEHPASANGDGRLCPRCAIGHLRPIAVIPRMRAPP